MALFLRTRMRIYNTPGTYTWEKDPLLHAIDVIVKGSGGSGASGMSHTTTNARQAGAGGGGGAVNTLDRIPARELPDTATVIVGTGGPAPAAPPSVDGAWTPGNHGGHSSFYGMRAEGGLGGGWTFGADTPVPGVGGAGGLGVLRGGNGLGHTSNDFHTTNGVIGFLAGGGGGGRGAGYNATGGSLARTGGGTSSQQTGVSGTWRTTLALTHTSGNGSNGASTGQPGDTGHSPSGGGGGGAGGNPGTAGGRGGHGLVLVIEYLRTEQEP